MNIVKKSIAIIGLSTLEETALMHLLGENADVDCKCFYSYTDFDCQSETYDIILTDSGVVLNHLEYFLPRKSITAIIENRRIMECEGNSSGFMIISRDDSAAQILTKLRRLCDTAKSNTTPAHELSQREKEVLCKVAAGKTNKEIASDLFISVNTVITHRKNISEKLGIKSVSGLSLYAMMNGLL